jgi:hypothetical protein
VRNLKRQIFQTGQTPAAGHAQTTTPHAILRLTPGGASLGALLWTEAGMPYKSQTAPDPGRVRQGRGRRH